MNLKGKEEQGLDVSKLSLSTSELGKLVNVAMVQVNREVSKSLRSRLSLLTKTFAMFLEFNHA